MGAARPSVADSARGAEAASFRGRWRSRGRAERPGPAASSSRPSPPLAARHRVPPPTAPRPHLRAEPLPAARPASSSGIWKAPAPHSEGARLSQGLSDAPSLRRVSFPRSGGGVRVAAGGRCVSPPQFAPKATGVFSASAYAGNGLGACPASRPRRERSGFVPGDGEDGVQGTHPGDRASLLRARPRHLRAPADAPPASLSLLPSAIAIISRHRFCFVLFLLW